MKTWQIGIVNSHTREHLRNKYWVAINRALILTHPDPAKKVIPTNTQIKTAHTYQHPVRKRSYTFHTQPEKGHTHPHPAKSKSYPPILSQNKGQTHPHPAKKKATPTQIQPKKVTFTNTQSKKVTNTHTHPHPAKKWSHPTQNRSQPPTHNWKKECHMSDTSYICENYSSFAILRVFFFEKDLPVPLFLLNSFEAANFLFVC